MKIIKELIKQKNNNKHHLLALFLILFYYFYSLLVFKEVVINPHDNLDIIVVYDHIINLIYSGDINATNYFLSGELKWFYIENIFYPINLLHYLFTDKQFYFFNEILKKILSYYSFYIFSKLIFKNKFSNSVASLFYASLVNKENIFGFGIIGLPYFLYLLLKNKPLKFKHIAVISFVFLNSSFIRDGISLFLVLPIYLILNNFKNNLKNIYIYLILFVSFFLISSFPIFLSLIDIGEVHRSEWIIKQFSDLNFLQNRSIIEYVYLIFLIYNFIFFLKHKKIKLLVLLSILVLVFYSAINPILNKMHLPGFLNLINSFQFERVNRILPFAISLLVIFNFKYLVERKINNAFHILIILISLFNSLSFLNREVLKAFFITNLKQEKYTELKLELKNIIINKSNVLNFINAILNKNNYKTNKFTFDLKTNFSFDNYYRFNEYKKVKLIVKNKRVASIGLDPMIAVMNNLYVIDGYHTLYPLSYKKKFRKIIEQEIEKNENLKKYFDQWGNRVYLFYNNKEYLDINFIEAYNLGTRYLISSFKINNSFLEFVDCLNCDDENNIYVYKINISN